MNGNGFGGKLGLALSSSVSHIGFKSNGAPRHTLESTMSHFALALVGLSEAVHAWAGNIAASAGREYAPIRSRLDQENLFFRQAMEEMHQRATKNARM